MGEDTQTLEEVVVTALGIKREQKALSYNVQQVKGDELTTVKDANFMNSLAGKVVSCEIEKKRLECAIVLKAIRMDREAAKQESAE